LAGRLRRRPAPRLSAIRLEGAGVRLGRHWALRDVSCELRRGERWLLTGANGAGKTVLLKLLRGDLWPTPTGRERRLYRIGDEWQSQPLEARERIAYLGPERQDRYERHGLDLRVDAVVATGFTGEDLPLEPCTAAQRRAARRALAEVGLAGLAARRFLALSNGQRRRVLLARALVGRPDVLLLDEATNGLDAASRRAFLRSLARASRGGLAWILSTHRAAERPPGITHAARLESGRLLVTGRAPARVARADGAARTTVARRIAMPAVATGSEPLLVLERVSVYRDGRRVLGPLDWTVAAGEHWLVAGPNGAGKSTLLALLYGDFAPAVGGRLRRRGCAAGRPIAEWQREVGIVSPELQSVYAATACTAEEIVVSGLYASIGLGEPPRPAERALARRWLGRLGLGGLGARRARELSYGQLRRALLARALIAPRRLLLLDEPFDGLDADARLQVTQQAARAARSGTQVVIATHHAEDVPAYVTRRLVLGPRGVAAGG
jgi:molybdate transport system ATP-binding protein